MHTMSFDMYGQGMGSMGGTHVPVAQAAPHIIHQHQQHTAAYISSRAYRADMTSSFVTVVSS